MEDVNPALYVSSIVKQGDLIGHAGKFCDQEHCWFNLHWELASPSPILDRWCPVNYFETESRRSIEGVWANVPANHNVKSKFPDIRSGDYANKTENLA